MSEGEKSACSVVGQMRRSAAPTFADFAAGPGRACFDRGKPSTRKAAARLVAARLLPAFGSLPLDRITRAGVTRWFDEYSLTAPGGANHALSLLRRILNHAVAAGHLQSNPRQEREVEPPSEAHSLSVARRG